jgi:hypothetical protein
MRGDVSLKILRNWLGGVMCATQLFRSVMRETQSLRRRNVGRFFLKDFT